ncbi:MAG: response regulator [Gammaproteobacteria bacterium]|nr:MAG: response regulator [Gammaproteobacteria bacterium]
MDKATLLFVDDELHILNALNWLFRKQYKVLLANSGEEAIELLKQHPVDVLVSDQRMPGMTGIDVLREARKVRPETLRILLTGYSDFKAIVGSVNEGEVFRFIQKPWDNAKIREIVAEAVEVARSTADAARKAEEAATHAPDTATEAERIGVMVLDEDDSITESITATIKSRHPVVVANSLEKAIEVLESQKIGVLISETQVGQTDVTALVKLLKQFHPEIVTVVVTGHNDAELVINLINEGQIYRFLPKPVKPGICKINVEAALRKHRQLAENPDLRIRHIVDKDAFLKKLGITHVAELTGGAETSAETAPKGFFSNLMARLRGLRTQTAN